MNTNLDSGYKIRNLIPKNVDRNEKNPNEKKSKFRQIKHDPHKKLWFLEMGNQNNIKRSEKEPCSLRAVKMMVPVSSPMRHSEMRVGRTIPREDEEGLVPPPFCRTVSEVKTLAIKVWPFVPGFIWSTFVKVGFLFAGLVPSSCETTFDDAIVLFFSFSLPLNFDLIPNKQKKVSVFKWSLTITTTNTIFSVLPDWCVFSFGKFYLLQN